MSACASCCARCCCWYVVVNVVLAAGVAVSILLRALYRKRYPCGYGVDFCINTLPRFDPVFAFSVASVFVTLSALLHLAVYLRKPRSFPRSDYGTF